MDSKKQNKAAMVISPKKKKNRKSKKAGQATIQPPLMSNLYRNSFMTDNTPGGLAAMLDSHSGRNRSAIYSYSNSVGASTSGIIGQSGNLYLDCLVDPSRGPIRLPDEFDKPTAVHQQVQYFTVSSGASGGANPGAFSVTVNPYIGLAAPAAFRQATSTINVWNGTAFAVASYLADADRSTLIAICNNIRPVSCSAYVTYIGDTLNNGGQIAAALIPGQGMTASYLSPTGQDLRVVGNLAIQPEAYSGPLSKGTYCYWTPEDHADTFFYSLADAAAYSYPVLQIAGVSTQFNTVVARVTVVVNYEYTTPNRLVVSLPSPIEPTLITHAKKVLQTQPNCVANDDHASWWTKVLDGARGFFTTLGNGVYSLFHPAISMISSAAQDPGLRSAVNDALAFQGGSAGLAAQLTR